MTDEQDAHRAERAALKAERDKGKVEPGEKADTAAAEANLDDRE